jgi:hypothetical protein
MPVLASHSRTVPTSDPDTIRVPSGENATDVIDKERRVNTEAQMPVLQSQSRTVPSSDPDTISVPPGENATDVTQLE